MSIKNSYDSNLNSKIVTSNILSSIKKDSLLSNLSHCGGEIYMVTTAFDHTPPFKHPLLNEDQSKVFIDGRTFSGVNREGTVVIKNDIDYEFLKLAAVLELAWENDNRIELSNMLSYSSHMFVRWLSGIMTNRFGLDPLQSTKVLIYCALYSVGLFSSSAIESQDLDRHVQQISKTYYLDSTEVYKMIDQLEGRIPADLHDFVTMLVGLDLSPRFKDLNLVLIYNMLGGSWFGAYAKDHVALALEYPPLFGVIVYSAVKNRVYRRTGIGKTVDHYDKGNEGSDFVKSLARLINI